VSWSATAREYDVVVVGAGPSGSACAYWLARAGWSVALVDKKHFPREKTCGDGLTPRSVRQLADMGLETLVAEHGHRYRGLRAHGYGASLELEWPAVDSLPTYGYTITRFSLDGLVAGAATAAGATLVAGVEATGLVEPSDLIEGTLRTCRGVTVREVEGGREAELRARYLVVADGQNSRIGRDIGTMRNRQWPMGMALRGYWTSDRHDEPWIESQLDLRTPNGSLVPGYGWVFPLGDGRVNVGVGLLSTDRAYKGVNTTKLLEYYLAQVGGDWGLTEATRCSEPTGGRLNMGLSIAPRVGPNSLTIGDAASAINPFNGEGIAYAYETGRLAAATIGLALASGDAGALRGYESELQSRYGDYYKVARAFVRIISEPQILAGCVSVGLRIPPVMRVLLPIMANLMNGDGHGVAEVSYRALVRLADVLPEEVFNRLTGAAEDERAESTASV
jgi:geranylgeranyl reductase family protein